MLEIAIQPGKKTQKFFWKNEQNNEHNKQLNPKIKVGAQNKK